MDSNTRAPKKLKESVHDDVQLSHAYSILANVAEKRSQPKDECALFAEHMAAKLRKFDPMHRAYAERQIYKIVADVEMQILLSQQHRAPPADAIPPNSPFHYSDDNYSSSSSSQNISTPLPSPNEQNQITQTSLPGMTEQPFRISDYLVLPNNDTYTPL